MLNALLLRLLGIKSHVRVTYKTDLKPFSTNLLKKCKTNFLLLLMYCSQNIKSNMNFLGIEKELEKELKYTKIDGITLKAIISGR